MKNLRIHELRPCRYLFAMSKERSNMLRSFGMLLCAQSTGHFCALRHSFSIYFARWRAACLILSNSGQRAGTIDGNFSGFESRGAQPPEIGARGRADYLSRDMHGCVPKGAGRQESLRKSRGISRSVSAHVIAEERWSHETMPDSSVHALMKREFDAKMTGLR